MRVHVSMHPEDYIHRIGGTGRAQAIGQAYTLVTPDDARMVHRIEYILKQKIEKHKVSGLDYSAPTARIPNAEGCRYVEANRREPNRLTDRVGGAGRTTEGPTRPAGVYLEPKIKSYARKPAASKDSNWS